MKPVIFLSLLLISISNFTYAQNINVSGKVIDNSTKLPVPFATLGIKGKSIGSVTDEKGLYSFLIEQSAVDASDQLIISSIGYQPFTVPLEKFKQGQQTINLAAAPTTLHTVTIKPQKFKVKTYGRTSSSTFMVANMYTERNHKDDNLGKEQATVLSIDKSCYIKDFNMYLSFNRFQSVKFRLNFYSVKDGLPDKLIVDKDVLFDVTEKKGWVKVDLTKYDLYLNGYNKIAVGIQWVKSVSADTAGRSFSISVIPSAFHSMFFRDKSQASWKKHSSVYLAFNLTANSFNPGKEEEPQEDKIN